jgi:hypothetical protein
MSDFERPFYSSEDPRARGRVGNGDRRRRRDEEGRGFRRWRDRVSRFAGEPFDYRDELERYGRERELSEGGYRPQREFERFEEWQQPRSFAGGRYDYDAPSRFEPDRDQRWRNEGWRDYADERRNERPIERSSFAGRGPKGYQRSDERLKEDICERLMADPDIDASEVTVTVRDGEVTLEGSVETRAMKRAAEDTADGIFGLRQVHNRLRIEPREQQQEHLGASPQRTPSASQRAVEPQRSGEAWFSGKSHS